MSNFRQNDPSHYYKNIQLIKNQNQENCTKYNYHINTIDFGHSNMIYRFLNQIPDDNKYLV